MILYLDTSCLIKLYADEPGQEQLMKRLAASQIVATSLISYAEARAALARKKRESALPLAAYRKLILQLDADWEKQIFRISVTEAIILEAGRLAETQALRGLDAIHLASALKIQKEAAGEPVQFLSADEKLNHAAESLGFKDLYEA